MQVFPWEFARKFWGDRGISFELVKVRIIQIRIRKSWLYILGMGGFHTEKISTYWKIFGKWSRESTCSNRNLWTWYSEGCYEWRTLKSFEEGFEILLLSLRLTIYKLTIFNLLFFISFHCFMSEPRIDRTSITSFRISRRKLTKKIQRNLKIQAFYSICFLSCSKCIIVELHYKFKCSF